MKTHAIAFLFFVVRIIYASSKVWFLCQVALDAAENVSSKAVINSSGYVAFVDSFEISYLNYRK